MGEGRFESGDRRAGLGIGHTDPGGDDARVEVSLPNLERLRKRPEDAEAELPREMTRLRVTALRGIEVDTRGGAGYGEQSREDRLGAVPLPIPKRRQDASGPERPCAPHERALVRVVAGRHLRGVGVRRVEALGSDRRSTSRGSEIARAGGERVAAFRRLSPAAPPPTAGLLPTASAAATVARRSASPP